MKAKVSLKDLQLVDLTPSGFTETPLGGGWQSRIAGQDLVLINPAPNGDPKFFFTTMTAHSPSEGIYRQPMIVEAHKTIKGRGKQTLVTAGAVRATFVKVKGVSYVLTQKVPRHGLAFILKREEIGKVLYGMAWTKIEVTEMVRGSVTKLDKQTLFAPGQLRIRQLGTEIHNNARSYSIIYQEAAFVKGRHNDLPWLPQDIEFTQYEWMPVNNFAMDDPNPFIECKLKEDGYSIVVPRDGKLGTSQDGFGSSLLRKAEKAGLI
jgi:hypothetical protein